MEITVKLEEIADGSMNSKGNDGAQCIATEGVCNEFT